MPQRVTDSRALGIEADHANGLASYHAATTANVLGDGDEAYDGSYWQARNPQNVIKRIVANHIPAYLIGGEFDIFQNGEPVNYAELQNAWDGRSPTAPMRSGVLLAKVIDMKPRPLRSNLSSPLPPL